MTQYTILCLASYFKGGRFLEECKAQGCYTILLTKEELRDEAWPRHAIDELLLMPTLLKQPDITYAVSYLCRHWRIDRIVALDDYDVETVAELREHLRLPGMGSSQARLFLPCPTLCQCLIMRNCTNLWHALRRRGCSSRVPKPVPWASRNFTMPTNCGRCWTSWAIASPILCWSNFCPAMSIMLIRSLITTKYALLRPTNMAHRP